MSNVSATIASPNQNLERAPVRRSSDLRMSVHCGCGYRTEDLHLGIEHAEVYGHTLDINGTIRVTR